MTLLILLFITPKHIVNLYSKIDSPMPSRRFRVPFFAFDVSFVLPFGADRQLTHPTGEIVEIVGINSNTNGRSCVEHHTCGCVLTEDTLIRL